MFHGLDVFNVFNAFGYFEEQDEDQKVLDGIARALKPGGRFLIDVMNHDNLMTRLRDREWDERPDGSFFLERRAYDIRSGRINTDWVYVAKDGKRRRQSHSVRMYTFPELAGMLSKAGLTVANTWGGFDGREFNLQAPRMVVLAEKG